MPRTVLCALSALSLLAGCRTEGGEVPAAKAPPRPEYLATVPRLDRSMIRDTTGSEDAAKLQLIAQVSFDSVLGFYRTRLPNDGWRVVADQADTAAATLMAQRGDTLLWVQVKRLGRYVTEYTLISGIEPANRPGPVMATPGRR